jgi:hypothetical protein
VIYLLNRSVYNGDALSRLNIRTADFPMHQYYTVGIRAPLEVADVIRECNIVKVTVVNDIIMVSGNTREWEWLVIFLRTGRGRAEEVLADNIQAALPDVFRNTSLMKRI